MHLENAVLRGQYGSTLYETYDEKCLQKKTAAKICKVTLNVAHLFQEQYQGIIRFYIFVNAGRKYTLNATAK
jgi:hypothetical protein